jgi:hypothetical protein
LIVFESLCRRNRCGLCRSASPTTATPHGSEFGV